MWAVMMLMLFLYAPASIRGASNQCFMFSGTTLDWSKYYNCTNVKLGNKGIDKIEASKGSRYSQLTILDLSNNSLTVLPEDFLSTATALKEVYLQDNELNNLPGKFLLNSSHLAILRLEGNPLSEIPTSVLHETLVNLTVDCRCHALSDIVMELNMNTTKYRRVSAVCRMSAEWNNLTEFYEKNCYNQYLALYIVLPILLIGLIGGGVALYMWKRKTSSTSLESKGAADMSPAHGQPRYMSRNMEGTATTLTPGHRQDYENVFVGHLGTTETKPHGYSGNNHGPGAYRSKHMAEEDVYLESDINEGDQPIYTNTQGIYYNYSEPSPIKGKNKEEDDVYILPDQ